MSNPKISVLPDDPSAPPPPPLPPWKRNGASSSPLSPIGNGVPDILSRISQFLPQLQEANKALQEDIVTGRIEHKRIENVADDEKTYIEMNLGLGVYEEKRRKEGRRNRDGGRAKRCKGAVATAAAVEGGKKVRSGEVESEEEEEEEEEEESSVADSSSDTSSSSSEADDDDDDSSDSSDNSDSTSESASESESDSDSDAEMLDTNDLVSAFLRNIAHTNPTAPPTTNPDGMEIEVLPDLSVRKRKRGAAPVSVDKGVLGTLMDIERVGGGGGGDGGDSGPEEQEDGVKSRKPLIEVVEEEDVMRD